jgi:tetratricopeptide (TPR) repeat protein
MGSYVQYISMTPLFVLIRFGKWDEILRMKQPDATQVYANLLHHFGRGMSFTAKQNFNIAGKELDLLRELMKDSSLNIPFTPFSPAIEGAKVAEQLLLGAIHLNRKLYEGAIRHFKAADSIETNMVYNEPRDWLLNPKHYLGTAYLESGDALNAEQVFRKDLLYNSENGWALFGLYKALLAQKKTVEAGKVYNRFKAAFRLADIQVQSALY